MAWVESPRIRRLLSNPSRRKCIKNNLPAEGESSTVEIEGKKYKMVSVQLVTESKQSSITIVLFVLCIVGVALALLNVYRG